MWNIEDSMTDIHSVVRLDRLTILGEKTYSRRNYFWKPGNLCQHDLSNDILNKKNKKNNFNPSKNLWLLLIKLSSFFFAENAII